MRWMVFGVTILAMFALFWVAYIDNRCAVTNIKESQINDRNRQVNENTDNESNNSSTKSGANKLGKKEELDDEGKKHKHREDYKSKMKTRLEKKTKEKKHLKKTKVVRILEKLHKKWQVLYGTETPMTIDDMHCEITLEKRELLFELGEIIYIGKTKNIEELTTYLIKGEDDNTRAIIAYGLALRSKVDSDIKKLIVFLIKNDKNKEVRKNAKDGLKSAIKKSKLSKEILYQCYLHRRFDLIISRLWRSFEWPE